MRSLFLPLAVASAVLLASCGGGGGHSNDDDAGETVSVDLSGTAAKGRVAGARVTLHAVRADGSVDDNPVASTTTDSAGAYVLNFAGRPGQHYVVRVAGQSGTTHQDEATAASQNLPARFSMRTAFQVRVTGRVRAPVTPFSEMAVAAAEKKGGLTEANIAKGVSTVGQLLGFDPTRVDIKSTSEAATADEQKQALLLAAVSQMAKDGAAGCGSAAAGGDRTACVVEKLGGAASADTMKLEGGGVDVGAALAAGIATALDTPALRGNVSSAVAATVLSNLACTGSNCLPTPPTPPSADPVAAAIAAAKAMLTEVKSDWTALFVSGGTTGVGDLETQATRFGDAMKGVQAPVEMVIKDTGAMLIGIDFFNDYRAGRTTAAVRGRAAGVYASEGSTPPVELASFACRLYTDTSLTTQATAPANANVIGCAARYYMNYATGREYVHGFTMEPTGTTGQFVYRSRARSRNISNGGAAQDLPNNPSTVRTGTVTVAVSAGDITSFSATGELPPAFRVGGTTVIGDHNTWTLSGSQASNASTGTSTIAFTGQVTTRDSAGAALGSLQIRSAAIDGIDDGSGGTTIAGARLDLGWSNAGAAFDGVFSASDGAWSADHDSYLPTRAALEGRFSTITGATTTEFATGRLSLQARGVAAFKAAQPTTSANFLTVDASFTGTVTAPGRPQLQLTFGTSHKTYEARPSLVTLQYRSMVAGAPRMTVQVTASLTPAGVGTVSLANPAAGLSLTATQGAPTANLLLNGSTQVGVLNLDTGVLTFTDGSFVSVELGQ
jgi:hypothetical protein